MNATRLLRSLGSSDVKRVQREGFLLLVLLIPLLTALLIRVGVPPLTVWLHARLGFDLSPYMPLIVSCLVIMMTPMAMGVLTGFMLLDERDERTLTAILVTPVPLEGYLAYRVTVPALLSLLVLPPATLLTGLVTLSLSELMLVSLAASLIAPCIALFFAAFAANKVEGFGLQKLLNVFLLAPVAAYFVPTPYQYLAGVFFPAYWPLRAYWSLTEGAPGAWFYLLLALASLMILCLLFVRHFKQVIYRAM